MADFALLPRTRVKSRRDIALLAARQWCWRAVSHSPSANSSLSRLPYRVFLIAAGPGGGTYFLAGQAIAGLESHPPGLSRCDMADVVVDAGGGPFRKLGPQRHIRVIADLLPEDVHLIAAPGRRPLLP